MFQEPTSSLNPTMKCGKQIEEIVSKHSFLKGTKIKDRVNELLRMVQLSKKQIYTINTLSNLVEANNKG